MNPRIGGRGVGRGSEMLGGGGGMGMNVEEPLYELVTSI
jgi:hypothetical protein